MNILQLLILFGSAVLGGTLNSVAGGGSFFSFPALILTGVPAIQANATSTVALWPGIIASAGAYRKELVKHQRSLLFLLIGTSLIGGALGAVLLLKTSQSIFVILIPYLLLLATSLFAFSGFITARLRTLNVEKTQLSIPALLGVATFQFIIAIYGGYFGGGIGILMLATLALMGMDDIHMMNSLKTVLAACINGVAVITFIAAGVIFWPQALIMILGSILGGYGGAYYARKIDQKWIRIFVIAVGLGLTIYFFWRQL